MGSGNLAHSLVMNNSQSLSKAVLPGLLLLLGAACQHHPSVAHPAAASRATLLPPAVGGEPELASGQNEEDNQERRRLWMEERHRAAPGVDWRAIEAENARAAADRKAAARMQRAAGPGAWIEVGSRNQAGNVLTGARTADGSTLYLGSALGGVWKGPASGDDWTPISDHVYGGAGQLVIAETGGQTTLVRAAGGTVLYSRNDGVSWQQPQGLDNITDTRRMLRLDDNNQTLLLLARRTGWRLFRSTDQGANWSEVRDLSGYTPDIWTPRDQLGAVYLIDDDRLWRSTNAGTSWSAWGTKAPFFAANVYLGGHEAGGAGQVFSLAVQPTNSGAWELWRTEDAGASWTHPNDLPGMWNAFCTGTQTTKLIAYGGVDMYYSRDSGTNFQRVNGWAEYYGDPLGKLHADIMSIHALPDATTGYGERWYIHCHGGSYESTDRLRTVRNISMQTLGVGQYYSTWTSRRNPDVIAVGSQDQGYQWAVTPPPSGQPGPYADFDQLISGDYGHISSSDGSHDLVYSDYPGFVLVQEGEVNPRLITVDFPNGFNGQWLPFMVADPTDKKSFFLCGQKLWRYTRSGPNAWAPVQHTAFDFQGTLSSLEFSPLDPQRAWACTTNGKIFWSTDGGVNWTESADTGPGAHYFYGTTIVASERNSNEVWIAGSGYSTVAVRFSDDGGVTWRNRSQNLPRTLAYCMVEAPDGSGRMYLGTESGAWEWDPIAKQWNDILGADGPITLYWSVEAVPSRNLIRFGTYGRGVWDYAPGTPGFFPYGELMGEPNHLQLRASAQPLIGQSLQLSVSGAAPNQAGFLTICRAAAEVSDLGGTILVDLQKQALQFNLQSNAAGEASVNLTVPNTASLVGKEFFLQAVLQDPGQAGGWSLSHGLRALVGQ